MSFQNSKTFNKENKKDNDGETVIQEIPLFESEENILSPMPNIVIKYP